MSKPQAQVWPGRCVDQPVLDLGFIAQSRRGFRAATKPYCRVL